MRSDGETCGYWVCLPTRHSKKDARYSSDSVGGTSGAGTSESASRCFVTERKRQWEVREALNAMHHKLAYVTRTPRENVTAVKIWPKAGTSRERQL